jgi:phosphotransferase system  glucose/maltose/N-acetylglucosamine-specific IIC component
VIRLLNRVIAALAGVFAGFLAIAVPINFYGSLFSRSRVAQPGGQPDFSSGLGGSMIVLLLTTILGFVSYILIRFSFTSPKPEPPDPES